MFTREALDLETLPPPDARLCEVDEKIPIPYDDRGLIKIDDLVRNVKATIDQNYEWPTGLNVHHFYWPEEAYPSNLSPGAGVNPAQFRALSIHRGLLPKVFHSWLHIITDPPAMPEPDVMQYRNEAWVVARDLFLMARKTIVTEKQTRRRRLYVAQNPDTLKVEFNGVDVIGEAVMQDMLEQNFRGFEMQLQRQERIPEEHRIIDLEGTPNKIAAELGRLIVPKSLYFGGQLQVA